MSNNTQENISYRDKLALIIITATFIAIIILSFLYYYYSEPKDEAPSKIFSTLIPLFATWIGTVLAFYFGRENFEAASNRYEQIISKLTPEILDDIPVNQIMITTKTMVKKNMSEIQEMSIKDVIDFLVSVDKSRLPVIEEQKVKYILHKSTLLSLIQADPSKASSKIVEFISANESTKSFLAFNQKVILEDIVNQLKMREDIKDVFLYNDNDVLAGWLTDSLIMRYMTSSGV